MQGFPIDLMHSMSNAEFTSGNLTELAGNMVSVPVTLALVTSLFASVPWTIDCNPAGPAPDEQSDTQVDAHAFEGISSYEEQRPLTVRSDDQVI